MVFRVSIRDNNGKIVNGWEIYTPIKRIATITAKRWEKLKYDNERIVIEELVRV